VHELDRAHVEPAGGLAGQQHAQLPAELAGQDDLLLVAARQRARRGVHRGRPHVELGHPGGRVGPRRGQVQGDTVPGVGRLVVHVEHHVVGHREAGHHPVGLTVLGHVADAGPDPLPRRGRRDVLPGQRHRARAGRPQPHQRLAELGLPVALHAGDAEDLARPHLEAHPGDRVLAPVVGHVQAVDLQDDGAGHGRGLADLERHLAADHQGG
jgi:hypothetical protein